jgi:hypothetical protein
VTDDTGRFVGTSTRRAALGTAAAGISGFAGCTGLLDDSPETIDPPSTLIATWRSNDPSHQVTLQWIVEADDEPDPVDIALSSNGTATNETAVTRFGSVGSYPPMYRHRATFRALAPDTEFGIQLRGKSTGLTVRTAPESIDEPLTFAQGGDIGTTGFVADLHQEAASWDPLFALVGGDLAYADGVSIPPWVTLLEQWHEHMRSDGRLIPIASAIGNHEVQGGIHGDREDAPFYYDLFDNDVREQAYWAIDIGESVSFLMLDSNHSTPVPGEQTEWLESALAERADREHVAVVSHVPAYPSSKPITGAGRDRVDVREHWVPLFEEYDVDIVFEHDDHTYKRTHLLEGGERADDGILYVGDGAWGKGGREAVSTEERPYLAVSKSKRHVIRVEFGPDGSRQYRAVDPNGETIDHFDGRGQELTQ